MSNSFQLISFQTNNIFQKCNIIPQNMERFISFTLDNIQVLDSFQFLSESLDKLANNLKRSKHTFPITTKVFEKFSIYCELKEMLFQKAIYPYEYMNSFEKFKETRLPSKNDFYSSLNQTHISDDDYQNAVNIWNKFKIKNLRQYCDNLPEA